MKVVMVCLTALAVGCGRPDPRVALSGDFTRDEEVAVERAAAKWNSINRVKLSFDGLFSPWKMEKEFTPDMAAKSFVGQTDYPGKTIRIKPGLSDTTFYATVLHELGHAQGLHHIAGPGVMNPSVGATEFSAGDIAECRAEGACGYSEVEAAKLRLQGVIE